MEMTGWGQRGWRWVDSVRLMLPPLSLPKFAYKSLPVFMPVVWSAGSSDSELLESQSMWFISCNVTSLTTVRQTWQLPDLQNPC